MYQYSFFIHIDGANIISIGIHSSLPSSISRLSVYLERFESSEKLQVGPTLIRPGPILLKQVVTEVNDEVKSILFSEMIRSEAMNISR